MVELLVSLFYGYCLVGLVFGVYFVSRGAARLDTEAHDLSWSVRLLLLPASIVLWPLLLRKRIRAGASPTQPRT